MKNKSIDLVNEKTERKELLEWIPMLVKKKLNSLTTAQLRIIHYILGYESREINTEALMEEFEGYGYSEEQALEIAKILKRDNFLIMQKPY
ncbi:hypothetical protein DWZ61_08390 [Clostridium sp. AF34-10BH]|uniref:hypothetical protein n=1 Tax=Clostridium sp. AF34-10BH TaxID=2293011 RepID=UPI000E51AE40|nr:hypothetical protein [Clostridium sp. AF34-10BH]RHP31402.1 hypothetical protein DWZ61_08390 [Clostridium sp. AF34-10BH]